MNGLYRFHVSPDVTRESIPVAERSTMTQDNRDRFSVIVREIAGSILRGSGYTISALCEGCYVPDAGPVSHETAYILDAYGISDVQANSFASALATALHQDSILVARLASCDVSFVGAA